MDFGLVGYLLKPVSVEIFSAVEGDLPKRDAPAEGAGSKGSKGSRGRKAYFFVEKSLLVPLSPCPLVSPSPRLPSRVAAALATSPSPRPSVSTKSFNGTIRIIEGSQY